MVGHWSSLRRQVCVAAPQRQEMMCVTVMQRQERMSVTVMQRPNMMSVTVVQRRMMSVTLMQRQEVMSVTVICAALPSAGARQITLERTLMANRCRRRGPEMGVKSGIGERKFSWTMTGGRRSSPRVQRQECQHQARRNARRTRWQLGRGLTEKHL